MLVANVNRPLSASSFAAVAVHLNFQNRQFVQRRRSPSSPQRHQSIASTLVTAYCVAGEFGFPAGFGAEPVAGPTWTASPLCSVSGGLSITWSCGDRPAVTSTASPKSSPSWIALRATLPSPPRMATWVIRQRCATATNYFAAPGAHDDVANAVAGVVDVLTASKSGYDGSMRRVSAPYDDEPRVIRTPHCIGRIFSRH